jgi:hypothetical protein
VVQQPKGPEVKGRENPKHPEPRKPPRQGGEDGDEDEEGDEDGDDEE